MRCNHCGVCCTETEMLLSNEDIKRLEKLGFHKKYFVKFDKAGYALLKNREGYCVFYDLTKKQCSVYESKPSGCCVYPVILDENTGIIIDEICQTRDSITLEEKEEKGKEVINLLQRIDAEAKCRH